MTPKQLVVIRRKTRFMSGFSADAVPSMTWVPKGWASVVRSNGQRQRIGAASALGQMAPFCYATSGRLTGEPFVELLSQLHGHKRSVNLSDN